MSSTSCCWLTSERVHLRGHLAEVEHRDAVGDLQHLVHVVRDQDDGQAPVGEASYEAEDLGGLRHPEGGGGLVEHDHLGVPEHRLGDRHGLPLTAGEAGDPLADRLHGAHRQRLEGLLGRLLHAALVERDAAAPLTAEEHVLDDVEVVAQREVLVDDLDAEGAGVARRVHGDRAALEEVVARVDGVGAAHALDQRGLAGAVVADERGDLAGLGAEVDALEDVDRPEALEHVAQREDRLVAHRSARSFSSGAGGRDGAGWPPLDGAAATPVLLDHVGQLQLLRRRLAALGGVLAGADGVLRRVLVVDRLRHVP